jgi:hypothetical protein
MLKTPKPKKRAVDYLKEKLPERQEPEKTEKPKSGTMKAFQE